MYSVPNNFLHRTLSLAGLVALVLVVLWPALSGGFIFDDYPVVVDNPVLHVTGWHWQEWQAIWSWSQANIQRPMAMLSYALNYALDSHAFGFKLTNLCLHLLNTWLVWLLVRRFLAAAWTGQDRLKHVRSNKTEYWALGVAAAWALHPLQVSTVMYVVQRMEILSFTFVLLALLAYWHGRQQQQTGNLAWPWLALVVVLGAVGLSFKETAILIPGYALLLELTVLRFAAQRPITTTMWKRLYTAGVATSLVFVAAYLVPHYSSPAFYVGRDFTAWQRELTQLRVLPMYIGWGLLPIPDHLQFYYDNFPASMDLVHPMTTLLGGLCLLGLLVLATALRKRRPLFALGIGWFFVAHLLTSAPVPLELVFEHRNYPALLGIALAAADLAYCLSQRTRSKVIIVVACVLVANLAFLTTLRAATWGDPFRLSMHLTEINPGSPRAALDFARRLMARSQGNADSPMYAMSIRELQRAAHLKGSSPLPEETLLIEASKHPGTPTVEWWNSMHTKLETQPLVPDTFVALHKLFTLRVSGNTGIDAHQLARCYAMAIQRNPGRQMLHEEYAELAGTALEDPILASEEWVQAVHLSQDAPRYAHDLATQLLSAHRGQEAQTVISVALALHPSLQNDPQWQSLLHEAKSVPATGAGGSPQTPGTP